jgi:hypothetical protein
MAFKFKSDSPPALIKYLVLPFKVVKLLGTEIEITVLNWKLTFHLHIDSKTFPYGNFFHL